MPIINQIIQERVDVWYGMLKSEKLLIRPIRENDVLENDTDGIELSASVLSLHPSLTIVVANVSCRHMIKMKNLNIHQNILFLSLYRITTSGQSVDVTSGQAHDKQRQ